MPHEQLKFDRTELSLDEAVSIVMHEMESHSSFNVTKSEISSGGAIIESSMHNASVKQVGGKIMVTVDAGDKIVDAIRAALRQQARTNKGDNTGVNRDNFDVSEPNDDASSPGAGRKEIEMDIDDNSSSNVQATIKVMENGEVEITHSDGTESELSTLMGVFIGNDLDVAEMYIDENLDMMLDDNDLSIICNNIKQELEEQVGR